jgi:hypothetical protein
MEITEEQYARIKDSLPLQRGNVRLGTALKLVDQRPSWLKSTIVFDMVVRQ